MKESKKKQCCVMCFFCPDKGLVVVEFPVNQKKQKQFLFFLSAEKMKKKQYQINRIVLELLNG